MNGQQLSPMARAVWYLIQIADEIEAGPGEILADHPEPAGAHGRQARRLADSRRVAPVMQLEDRK